MKKLTSIILILFLSFLSSSSWSKTLTIDDLVERNDLYYKKFSDVPFTGKTTEEFQGSFKDGIRNGQWVSYHNNGQLWYKGEYKDGKPVGKWVFFKKDGTYAHKKTY